MLLNSTQISENENRKEFTFSERVDWARRLERVERVKSEQREKAGKKIDPTENLPEGKKGETRDIVAGASGFGSGKQYEKAKYIADNADPEIIAQLDDDGRKQLKCKTLHHGKEGQGTRTDLKTDRPRAEIFTG
ncbi:hypothetical protein ABE137_10325 [Brevibacillus laterosporus]|uniref:hypothetical protein n=1 Tax=Brevibacillus laterosporus TaxID=1465 RepID=UPI003D219A63